jgi:class 3 adenylate cyclase
VPRLAYDSSMRDPLAPYVPRLLDEPWEGARVVGGSIAICDITGFTALTERLSRAGKEGSEKISDAINGAFVDLIEAAESLDGDVFSFGGDAMAVLFVGDGRHDRACKAAHAMQEVLKARPKMKVGGAGVQLTMSAGIATGPIHLIIAGMDPKTLVAVGPTVTRALDLESRASAGETWTETDDYSAIETKGTLVGLFPSAFIDQAVRDVLESGTAHPEHRPAAVSRPTVLGDGGPREPWRGSDSRAALDLVSGVHAP